MVNDRGGLWSLKLTPGNTDDRTPLPELSRGLVGKLFGDKGYISQDKAQKLAQQGIELITKPRHNRKPVELNAFGQAYYDDVPSSILNSTS